ncbi:MBL fold metallo-hydrolase [Rosenbergiella nectarea]|uniref:MBL fold metallo-hydrolase n=1 Tax=Rosenbergiella nectarea TaxID=988801 RepID=UPI001F4D9EA2|nr:MBL fold metallo-hydrolase [Rosenbergiella nectarea]
MSHPFPFRQIGDFLVTALSDGKMLASLDLLSGINKSDAHSIQSHAGITEPGDIHINGYLIQGLGRTILVDTGTGSLNNTAGQLNIHLAAVGVRPDDVDTVLLTHCHPDHIGGLLDSAKQPVFKQADIMLHPLEAQYWRDDDNRNKANERGQRNIDLVRLTLDTYEGQVRFLNDEKIVAGILPVWLPGHTPGHTGFLLYGEEQSLLIWGDIVHYPHIQSAQPAVSILFDVDSIQAEETRKNIMEKAVSEKLVIGGMHLSQAGFARVLRKGRGYCIDYAENNEQDVT